jgi:hypothetical protein
MSKVKLLNQVGVQFATDDLALRERGSDIFLHLRTQRYLTCDRSLVNLAKEYAYVSSAQQVLLQRALDLLQLGATAPRDMDPNCDRCNARQRPAPCVENPP